ncbi:LysR family transcriptional regulator [Ramlibacter sp. MMS24-I3-19]|uniref:LysR family transcriptional regulator n=1 Tax=Ramlibacter sp. MMS24-I3-19 TaxID=3416606 RepID=UPI003D0196B7
MDRMRALEYFVAAAQSGSFSAAARSYEVTVPAVMKLVAALERSLGARLFDRSTHGLALTSVGQAFLEECRPALETLLLATDAASNTSRRASGNVVVRAPQLLSRLILVPALHRLHAAHPNIQVDLRPLEALQITNADGAGVDLLFALGISERIDLVGRPLAQTRLLVCATPQYLQRQGRPRTPQDLRDHQCLQVRSPEGTVIDLWRLQRGEHVEEVAVSGYLVSESRDVVLEAVLQGQGISRFADLSIWPHLQSGRLEPVLPDWYSLGSPMLSSLYRASSLRQTRVRTVLDHVTAVVREVELQCRREYPFLGDTTGSPIAPTRPGRMSKSRRSG